MNRIRPYGEMSDSQLEVLIGLARFTNLGARLDAIREGHREYVIAFQHLFDLFGTDRSRPAEAHRIVIPPKDDHIHARHRHNLVNVLDRFILLDHQRYHRVLQGLYVLRGAALQTKVACESSVSGAEVPTRLR